MYKKLITKNSSIILIASSCLLAALPARSAVITEMFANTKGAAQAKPEVADPKGPEASHVTSFATDSDSFGSAFSASAFGYAGGAYATSASGEGIFSSDAEFRRVWKITNDAVVPQNFTFNF